MSNDKTVYIFLALMAVVIAGTYFFYGRTKPIDVGTEPILIPIVIEEPCAGIIKDGVCVDVKG